MVLLAEIQKQPAIKSHVVPMDYSQAERPAFTHSKFDVWHRVNAITAKSEYAVTFKQSTVMLDTPYEHATEAILAAFWVIGEITK